MRPGRNTLMWSFLALCSLFFFVKGCLDQTRVVHSVDFQPVYAGAKCLLVGCNPYDGPELRAAFLQSGGVLDGTSGRQFETGSANYPPSALFLVTPLALLRWGLSHVAWLIAIGSSMTAGTLAVADLCGAGTRWPVFAAIGIFLAGDTWLLLLGQPAGVAIGLCIVAVWCLLQRRYQGLGVLCFALSLAIKPQMGSLLWLYFLAEPSYRKRALQILMATCAVCLPGVVWASVMPASRHWFWQMRHVVGAIARDKNVGADPDAMHFVQLQPVLQLLNGRASLIDHAVHGFVLLLLLACLFTAMRQGSSMRKDRFALAAIACLTLLPVYHRDYDTRLLLLVFPATGVLFASRRWLGVVALTVVTLLGLVTSPFGHAHLFALQAADGASWSAMETVLMTRSPALLILVLGLIFLYSTLRVTKPLSTSHFVAET